MTDPLGLMRKEKAKKPEAKRKNALHSTECKKAKIPASLVAKSPYQT